MTLLPEPAIIQEGIRGSPSWKEGGANVFRGPKEMIPMTSTPGKCCLEKTRLLFSCDEYHMRCCGSLRDPEGRAICECSPVIGSLKEWVRVDS
jgi:hypothetical protein